MIESKYIMLINTSCFNEIGKFVYVYKTENFLSVM